VSDAGEEKSQMKEGQVWTFQEREFFSLKVSTPSIHEMIVLHRVEMCWKGR
jgi:hypothetical protein